LLIGAAAAVLFFASQC